MHILVVDDDVWIRDGITQLLLREGYLVSTAEDGEAAYSVLCRAPVDLLITDEDMPRLHGIELLRRIRREKYTLPAILISGCLPWDTPDLEELLNPGVALEKPFNFTQLLGEVRALTSKDSIDVDRPAIVKHYV